ncbi:WXG100 family type VII secretion target [Micromonospora sp. NPDC005553]|uniref:WXG100 family type VII secretion target n=1 Tax=unclassified Micromonospora TaxID=2617518 RepID=UPI0033A4ADB3
MSDGIQVDLDALHGAAASLATTGQQLGAEIASLESTVNGAGNPWGDDEAGSLFGAAYMEVLTHALDVYRSMADQLLEAAGNLDASADAHETTEIANTELFTRMELPSGYATPS